MRPLSYLTNPYVLIILQQLVSVWFLVDFFLARDSSTADHLRRRLISEATSQNSTLRNLHIEANGLRDKLCPSKSYNEPYFDKVILVVIDALGAEFIPTLTRSKQANNNNVNINVNVDPTMPFLEEQIRQGKGMGFIVRAATPTVTMPRIKAMLSGTIPSFMDIMYNLASDVSVFEDENIVQIARANNKSIVFYGDDTWLSLFDRRMFLRCEETFSFFASDYTTVDTNVTERALPEVRRSQIDWDYLILHYLGLDHIGHVYGSNNVPLIQTKLLEMDTVIKELYQNMASKQEKTLLIIGGDHGMSSQGNHGGDSNLEVDTALVMLPINQELGQPNRPMVAAASPPDNDHLQQIDLAATLPLLTGLPIPKSSRGVAIKGFLDNLWSHDTSRVMCSLIDNALQLARLADKDSNSGPEDLVDEAQYTTSQLVSLMRKHMDSSLRRGADPEQIKLAGQEYYSFARVIQSKLIETITSRSNPLLVMFIVSLVMFLSLIALRRASLRLLMPLMQPGERLTCLYAIAMPVILQGSTDFIEYEHLFWPIHALLVTWTLLALTLRSRPHYFKDIDQFRLGLFVVTFLLSIILPRLDTKQSITGWTLPCFALMVLGKFSNQTIKNRPKWLTFWPVVGLVLYVKCFVEPDTNVDNIRRNALLQLVAWLASQLMMLLGLVVSIQRGTQQGDIKPTPIIQKLAAAWMWFAFLLARPSNFIFLISQLLMEASLNSVANSLRLSPLTRAVIYLQLASSAFYGQGNTNLFSSLDVRPAFFGQTRYSLPLAVPLVACSTFATQIYWYLKLFQRVQGDEEQERMGQGAGRGQLGDVSSSSSSLPETTKDEIRCFVCMRNYLSIGYLMFVCLVLRNHLFIWSVISPKLVYHFVTNLTLLLATLWISLVPNWLHSRLETSKVWAADQSTSRRKLAHNI